MHLSPQGTGQLVAVAAAAAAAAGQEQQPQQQHQKQPQGQPQQFPAVCAEVFLHTGRSEDASTAGPPAAMLALWIGPLAHAIPSPAATEPEQQQQ